MTIAVFMALLSARAALAAYTTEHYILFGVSIAMFILFYLLAIAMEGRMLNRMKKLEEELDVLKRRA